MICPLCRSRNSIIVGQSRRRPFIHCADCDLIFVPEEFHLSVEEERNRYAFHDNTAENKGYIRFLSQVADIAEIVCPPPGRLLDYGCGKNAVLTNLLKNRGRNCDPFDPLYGYYPPSPTYKYDTIILCEVIEHLRNVNKTLPEIENLLKRKGCIIIRTRLRPPEVKIEKWWYAQDLTHINFFSVKALEFAARLLKRSLKNTAIPDIFLIV